MSTATVTKTYRHGVAGMRVPTATGDGSHSLRRGCQHTYLRRSALTLLWMFRVIQCHVPRFQYLRTDRSLNIRMKMFNDSVGFTALEKSVY